MVYFDWPIMNKIDNLTLSLAIIRIRVRSKPQPGQTY
jgi:hypothetical protein